MFRKCDGRGCGGYHQDDALAVLSQAGFIAHVDKQDIGRARQLMSCCGTVEGLVHLFQYNKDWRTGVKVIVPPIGATSWGAFGFTDGR